MALPNTYVDLAQYSLAKGNGTTPPEIYIPLWWYSGAMSSSTYTSAGASWVLKGGIGTSNATNSTRNLHALNASWGTNTKYALEIALWATSTATAYAQLYDITASAVVTGSQISTTSNTATVLRSSQFTLIPGHVYGLTVWTSNSSNQAYFTDASLIVFPS